MSISEISAVSQLPLRRSARITPIAARAFGPGACASTRARPPTAAEDGHRSATASGEAPSSRPSLVHPVQAPGPWTRVNGRRSSTLITTRFGSFAHHGGATETTTPIRSDSCARSRHRVELEDVVPPWIADHRQDLASGATRETPRTSKHSPPRALRR